MPPDRPAPKEIGVHFYQFNIGDYRRDTSHLTLLEHGIYRQLLDTYYLSENPIKLDLEEVMRTHSVRTADEERALKNVLKDFFDETSDGYFHKGCDRNIEAYRKKSKMASESAKARWSQPHANALPTDSERNANGMLTNNHKPLTNNQEPIKKSMQRGTRLPADFELPDDWVFFCKQERPELVPREVFAGFKDYWISQAGVKANKTDWFATWRNWVRNQKVTRMTPALSVTQKNKQEHYSKMFGRSDDERTIEAITPRLG
jgi:uncharacterized protein YdaU (DUF1376 family)